MMDENYQEFVSAFWTLVRSEDGIDTRETRMNELLRLSSEQALLMDSHNLAAMMSCCVMARKRYAAIADHFPEASFPLIVKALREKNQLPLMTKAGHRVAQLLVAMLATPHGRKAYHTIALALSQAREDRAIKPHLFQAHEKTEEEAIPSFADLEETLAESEDNDCVEFFDSDEKGDDDE